MTSFNHRQWLKSGALAAAGLTFGSSSWNTAPAGAARRQAITELPVIKARLSANENPFGPSQKARKAIIDAIPESFLYPRQHLMEFRKMVAQEEGVSGDHVLLGAGSGELLVATGMCYTFKGGAGSHVVSGDPSYMQLIRAATQIGCGWEKVPLNSKYDYDLEAMAARVNAKNSLVYICNPNNPTGILTDPSKLTAFCETVSTKKPVFVDEAYIDYVGDPKKNSMVSAIKKGQNVIVARTFSKVHSFAGLQIGYLIAQPDTIKEINKFGGGGSSISATSIRGAIVSYSDKEFVKYSVAKKPR